MEKVNNKLYIAITVLGALLVAVTCGYFVLQNNNKETDALKFKEEYESYNGKVNENNNKNYLEVNVDKNNPVVYKTAEEAVELLKTENAVFYFGWPTCPWCRNTIEPLLEALKEEKIDKLYYVNIHDIRDTYEVVNKKAEVSLKGTDAYYKLLDFFGDNLSKYTISVDDKKYDTGVTRLYAPTVVVVKNGQIVGMHEGTIDAQKDPYVGLTSDQKDELKNIFKDMIKKLNSPEFCTSDTAC